MSKRTTFTTVTPLPEGVTRHIVLDFLHDFEEMIDLNPLVKERHPIPAPPNASAEEQRCQWYSMTDKVSYFPGIRGDVTYKCAFHDLPNGLRTHCYAPAGLTIHNKWTVGGSLPGERPQPAEPGLNIPSTGLYLREDVDMRCNVIMTSFVKKTLKKSHATLVDRMAFKAEMAATTGKRRSNLGRSAVVSPEPSMMSSMGSTGSTVSRSTSSMSGQYPHLAESIPTSRPPSAASSVSCYSVQSSPMWSPPPATSLGTSPALTTSSTPSTDGGDLETQQCAAQVPPPSRAPPPPPTSIPELSFEPISITLSEAPARSDPDTPFLRNAKPAPIPVVHTPEPATPFLRSAEPEVSELPAPTTTTTTIDPETPFLRNAKPNWPLAPPPPLPSNDSNNWPLPSTTTTPSQHQQQQQQQPPRPRPRPQTHLFIQPYRPPQTASSSAAGGSPASGGGSSRVSPSGDGSGLSDDALWQALGGGRVGVAKGGDVGFGAGGVGLGVVGLGVGQGQGQGQTASHDYYHRPQYHQHSRARSYGGIGSGYGAGVYAPRSGSGSGYGYGYAQAYGSGHPDYPQLSPYDGRGVGSPLIGVDGGTRRVSMPPPARVPVPGMGGR